MELKLSKNAPCPCDSGKKYKLCCTGEISKEHEVYYALLHKEGIIKEKLVKWAAQNFNHDELNEYAYEFNKKNFDELEFSEEITPFFDWFFLEAVHKEKERQMLNVIINDFSYLFQKEELEIMGEWINYTQPGIFEIEKIDQGDWKISLREIFTDKRYAVLDRKASASAIKGDIIFARIQKIFSNYCLSGAVISYPRFTTLDQLKDFVNSRFNLEKRKSPSITYEQFMSSNSRLLNDFIPKAPKIVASDGEEAKICEAVYSIDTNCAEQILNWFGSDSYFLITEEDCKMNKLKSATIACLVQKNEKTRRNTNESPVLMAQCHAVDNHGNKVETEGSIEIKGNKLKIFSQSERVFKKVIGKIEKNIGEHLALKEKKTESVEDAIKGLKENEGNLPEKKKNLQLKKIENNLLREYYIDWCDQKIPALKNKTPRESMRTEGGKELLKKLLLDFENEEEHQKREGKESISAIKIIRTELDFYE